MSISQLIGKVINKIDRNNEDLTISTSDGFVYTMSPASDMVFTTLDIVGDIEDLLRTPIVSAYDSTGGSAAGGKHTFYIFRTFKGDVTLCWKCSGNGYYSEEIKFKCIKEGIETSGIRYLISDAEDKIKSVFKNNNLDYNYHRYRHQNSLELVFEEKGNPISLSVLNSLKEELDITDDQIIINQEEDEDSFSIIFKEILEWLN